MPIRGSPWEPKHISLPFARTKHPRRATGPHGAAAVRRRMVSVQPAHGHPEALHLSGGEDKLPLPCTSTDISSRGRSSSAGTRRAAHQPPPLPLHHPAAKTLLRDAADAALMVIKGEIIGRAGPREHSPDSCPAPRVPASLSPLRRAVSPRYVACLTHLFIGASASSFLCSYKVPSTHACDVT